MNLTPEETAKCLTIIGDMKQRSKPVYIINDDERNDSTLRSLIKKANGIYFKVQYGDDEPQAIFMSQEQQASFIAEVDMFHENVPSINIVSKAGEFFGGAFKGFISS